MRRAVILIVAAILGLAACTTSRSTNAATPKASTPAVNDVALPKPACHRVSQAFLNTVLDGLAASHANASVGGGFYFLTGTTIGPNVPRPVYEIAVMIDGQVAMLGNDSRPAHRNFGVYFLVAANDWARSVTDFHSIANPGNATSGLMRALSDPSNVAQAEACF